MYDPHGTRTVFLRGRLLRFRKTFSAATTFQLRVKHAMVAAHAPCLVLMAFFIPSELEMGTRVGPGSDTCDEMLGAKTSGIAQARSERDRGQMVPCR